MRHLALVALPAALVILLAACSSPAPVATSAPVAAPTVTPEPVAVSAELGAQLARQMACAGCHSANGNPSVGPTWKGLFGSERLLADSSTVRADEDYIRESIIEPNAKVVEGFPAGVMPQDFGGRLTALQIQSIIEYIKTLR